MGDVGKPIFEVVAEQVRVPLVDAERDQAWRCIADGHIDRTGPHFGHRCMGGENLEILIVVDGECFEGPIRRLPIA
jgi:hypothetical protein